MRFQVGPFSYALIISDRAIYDAEGDELEGAAVESRRMLVVSGRVEPERREEVAFHELVHAWHFHVPRPQTEEEMAQFGAFVQQQFRRDLDAQGGSDALRKLPPHRVELGRPVPTPASSAPPAARELFGPTDRMPCGACEADVMCGSIHNGEAALHEPTGKLRMERWFECEACGSVQTWQEFCTADGTPLGEFVSVPPPRLLHGAQASRWLAERVDVAI